MKNGTYYMKLLTTTLGIVLLGLSMSAQAVSVTVEASGKGYYHDYITNITTSNVDITQTWTFDTNDVPADIYNGTYSDIAIYESFTDWINGKVSVSGGTTVVDEGTFLPDPDGGHGRLHIYDERYGADYYGISTFSYDATNNYDYFSSSAYFSDSQDDILQGLDATQAFNWIDNDANDYGYGNVRWYNKTGSSYDSNVRISYTLTSISLATPVPEPTTLTLMGLGLVGLAFARKKKSA